MSKQVCDHYRITRNTMALVPSYRFDSSTLVIEVNKQFYVKQTALEIINNGCLEGYSSYKGRREAAIYQIGSIYKVPIAINPNLDIFSFPTHSPTHHDCHWLFYNHIKEYSSANNKPSHSIVTLSNTSKILVPISVSALKKQIHLTSHCMLQCKNTAQLENNDKVEFI